MTQEDNRHGRDPWALATSPEWEPTSALTVEVCRAAFEHAIPFTLGVEEELMLVEPVTLDLAPAIGEVLASVEGDERFTSELRSSQIELVTRVCTTASDACRELASARRTLIERIGGRYGLLGSGTHPFSTNFGDVTDGDRYRRIADEYVWAATRSLMSGLHVHVAVSGADRALAVHNALRSYLPEIAALGANSPFFEGRDTGMRSMRPKLNAFFPRSGVPPAFASWDELVAFVDWGRSGGLFPDASHFWWDLRLHPALGTIELRVADTQTRVEDSSALIALTHALVVLLARQFDAGEPPPVHEEYRIAENAWRAHRYGIRGSLVDLETGEAVPTRERIEALLEQLEPVAAELGSAEQLDGARVLLAGNGAERQRYVYERDGMDGVVRWLVEQTHESALDD